MKNLTLILSISITFLLVGCWDYSEINDMDIPIGMAVDYISEPGGKTEYLITSEMISIQNKGAQSTLSSKLVEAKGNSLFEAVRKLIETNGKVAFWPHTKVIILGEDFARNGILPAIDYAMRDDEFRSDTNIVVAKGCRGKEILENKLKGVTMVSMKIEDALQYQNKVGTFEETDLWNFMDKLSLEGFAPIAPLAQMTSDDQKVAKIAGLAVFEHDSMIGSLTPEETVYYLFINNEIENQLMVIEYQRNGELIPLTLEIEGNKTTLEPQVTDGRVLMEIKVNCRAGIAEVDSSTNILKKEDLKEIEKVGEKFIEQNMKNLIRKVQSEYGVDIFGFGNTIQKVKKKDWDKLAKSWDDEFENLEVKTEVKLTIISSGLSNRTLEIR